MLRKEGVSDADIRTEHSADMRYIGQFFDVNVLMDEAIIQGGDRDRLLQRFHAIHDRLYGYALPEASAEILNVRTKVVGKAHKLTFEPQAASAPDPSDAHKGTRSVYLSLQRRTDTIPVFAGERLGYGHQLPGPAIVELPTTTIFVPPEFGLSCDTYGSFVLRLDNAQQKGDHNVETS